MWCDSKVAQALSFAASFKDLGVRVLDLGPTAFCLGGITLNPGPV